MFLVKAISCLLWGFGQCFFSWILLFEQTKGNGFLTFEFGEDKDNGHCVLSIFSNLNWGECPPPFGSILSKNCNSASTTRRSLSVGMQYLNVIQGLHQQHRTNAYQIAWSLSVNLRAPARSDMKVWMDSISFVLPASIPPESWNTNPGLLSKTNSSSMLWWPRWEGC